MLYHHVRELRFYSDGQYQCRWCNWFCIADWPCLARTLGVQYYEGVRMCMRWTPILPVTRIAKSRWCSRRPMPSNWNHRMGLLWLWTLAPLLATAHSAWFFSPFSNAESVDWINVNENVVLWRIYEYLAVFMYDFEFEKKSDTLRLRSESTTQTNRTSNILFAIDRDRWRSTQIFCLSYFRCHRNAFVR